MEMTKTTKNYLNLLASTLRWSVVMLLVDTLIGESSVYNHHHAVLGLFITTGLRLISFFTQGSTRVAYPGSLLGVVINLTYVRNLWVVLWGDLTLTASVSLVLMSLTGWITPGINWQLLLFSMAMYLPWYAFFRFNDNFLHKEWSYNL
jgi:hypothetical protein